MGLRGRRGPRPGRGHRPAPSGRLLPGPLGPYGPAHRLAQAGDLRRRPLLPGGRRLANGPSPATLKSEAAPIIPAIPVALADRGERRWTERGYSCLLYTSDAADDLT